jgi:hypothetical protein
MERFNKWFWEDISPLRRALIMCFVEIIAVALGIIIIN